MSYRTAVFDLDGTLLDTLPDLHAALNHALSLLDWPQKELSDTRRNVGNGIRRLIQLSAPENASEEQIDRCFDDFISYYSEHLTVATVPYPGIPELIRSLSDAGVLIAVATNKYDAGAKTIIARFFGDLVSVTLGDTPGAPRKPDRAMVDRVFEITGADPKKAVYIGDSEVDLLTAANAGLPFIAVSWGYRDESALAAQGARIIARSTQELYDLILSDC
ncbi:MAG: HAD family hydrolase [Oscillospiraceae bacterium]|nr:HAD family hydrolase [Oscillospiraceae bacterium]